MINFNACGMFIKLAKITIKPEKMYIAHIVGVKIVVTLAILLIPPTTTKPINTAQTKPITQA